MADTKTVFSLLNIVSFFALMSLGKNHVIAAVFGDHIAGWGGGVHAFEKEPVPEYLQAVVSCRLGKPHRQYPECRCGERVEIVPEDEIPVESQGDYHVRTKYTGRGIKNIYYHCLFCSQCLDGVRTLSNCSRMADTQCTTSCIKPTDIFDNGRKACVPDPRFEEETTKRTDATNSLDANELQSKGESTNNPSELQSSDNHTPNGSSRKSPLFLPDDKYLLIVGWALVIAVVVILIVNIFVCKFLYHRRKHDQEKERMLPNTTSTASMTDIVHV